MADPIIVKRRGRRLRSCENVRALIAATLRDVEQSSIPAAQKAKLLLYGAQTLIHAIQAADASVQAEIRETQKIVEHLQKTYAEFKGSPEFAAWVRRRALEEKGDADDGDDIDPGVLSAQHEAQRKLAEAERVKREDAHEQEFLRENAPALLRQMPHQK